MHLSCIHTAEATAATSTSNHVCVKLGQRESYWKQTKTLVFLLPLRFFGKMVVHHDTQTTFLALIEPSKLISLLQNYIFESEDGLTHRSQNLELHQVLCCLPAAVTYLLIKYTNFTSSFTVWQTVSAKFFRNFLYKYHQIIKNVTSAF